MAAISYIKNVAKSFGYAIGDTFRDLNPVVTTLAKESKNVTSELYESIKSVTFEKDSIDEKSFKGKARDIVSSTWNNFKDDIKSGNWYNKERKDAADLELAKAFGMDFDFDFEDNWDFDDPDSDSAQLAMDSDNTREIIDTVDAVGSGIANTVATATVESASYIVASNNRSTKALYSLNERGFASVTKGIISLNNTFASFAQIMEPMQEHMQNSLKFYTRTEEILTSMDQSIQQLVKNTTPAPLSSSSTYYSSKRNKFTDIFDSDSGLSIESYKEMIKENLGEYKDLTDMALGALKGITGGGKNISVMQFATTMFTQAMIPKMFKESMKNFNDELKYFMAGGINKIRNRQGGFIFEIFKDLFLPKDTFISQIDPSRYNREAVAWDGTSRKALTEVIPDALMMIYEALTGDNKRYDYSKGKFVSVSSIKKDFDDSRKNYVKSAGGEFRTDALKKAESIKDNVKRDQISKEIENYFYQAFMSNDGYNVNSKKFDKSKYGVSDEAVAILKQIINEDRKTGKKRHQKFVYDNISQRELYGNYIRSQESAGDSAILHTLNGSDAARARIGGTGVDKWGNDSLFYLRGIYSFSGFIADNLRFIAGKSDNIDYTGINKRRTFKNKASTGYSDNVFYYKASNAGEKTKEEASRTTANESSSTESFFNRDEEADKKREENINNAKGQAKTTIGKVKSWFHKMFGGRGEKGQIQQWYEKPFNSVALLLDKIGGGLDKLLWGTDETPEKGLFGYLFEKAKKTFGDIFDTLDKKFGLKNAWEKFKSGDFAKETGEKLRSVGSSIGNTVKRFFGKGDKYKDPRENVDTAAHGRKVTKSGIVAVSEGELIIPSELNPYYHGATNKASQVRNEENIVNRFFGSYASGGTVGKQLKNAGVDDVTISVITKLIGEEKFAEAGKVVRNIEDRFVRSKAHKIIQEAKKSFNAEGNGGAGRKFVKSGIDQLGKSGKEFFDRVFGGKEATKKENEEVNEKVKKILEEAGINKGSMGAGAIIGGGVSLLTGAMINPILGVAAGAAIGLASNSKYVQNLLFGNEEERGLLPKKMVDFIKESLPSMGKGAAIGGGIGLFAGSPILGAILGSTVGYISSSEKAKNYIFGEMDEEGNRKGGLIPKDLQDLIKKNAPNISAGMIAGLALGPFGIAGNLIAGAGLGFITSSEKFHDWMFDKKDGLATKIHDKVINNIDSLFHNLTNNLLGLSKRIAGSTGRGIRNLISDTRRSLEEGKMGILGKVINSTIGLGGRVIKGTVDKVGDTIEFANRRVQARNLARGYAVYGEVTDENGNVVRDEKGRVVKRNLTAEERLRLRNDKDNSTSANIDKLISKMNTSEDLTAFQNELKSLKDPDGMYKRAKNSAITKAYTSLEGANIDRKTIREIGKLISSGKFDKARNIAESITDTRQKEQALNTITEAESKLGEANANRNSVAGKLAELKKQGIDLSNPNDIQAYIDRIEDERKLNDKFSKENQEKAKEDEYKKTFIEIVYDIDKKIAEAFGGEPVNVPAWLSVKANTKIEGAKNTVQNLLFGNKDESNENEPDTRYEMTAHGPKKMIKNSQGEWVEDLQDSGTAETIDKEEEQRSNFATIAKNTGFLAGIGGLFGKLHDKLFGEKDGEKKGIFSKLIESITGENGLLGSILHFFTGNKVTGGISSFLSKFSFKSLIPWVASAFGLYLVKGGLDGKFNELGKKLGISGGGDKTTAKDTSGNIHNVKVDEKGNAIIDENGNYIDADTGKSFETETGSTEVTGSYATQSLDTKLENNIRKGLLGVSRGSVVDLALAPAKKKLGVKGNLTIKSIGSGLNKAGNKIIDLAASETPMVALATYDAVRKFGIALSKVPGFRKFKDVILDKIVPKIGEVAEAAMKKSGKLISKFGDVLENLAFPLKIAAVTWDVSEGMQDARNTFQITTEPSFPQKLIAGAIRAIKNFIPFIGTLIPDTIFVDIFCEFLAPALGIDVNKLKSDRAAAEEEAKEAGFNSVTDYLKTSKREGGIGDYTLGEKAGNAIKTSWQNVKQGAVKFGSNVKTWASNAGNAIKSGLESAKTKVGNFKEDLKSGFTDLNNNFSLIREKVKAGDISGLWNLQFKENPEDPAGGITKGIFNAVKLLNIPDAGIFWAGNKIKEGFTNITNKVKNTITALNNERKYGEELFRNPESKLTDLFVIEDEDPENPMGGFTKAIRITSRLTGIPVAMIKVIGGKIKETFNNTVAKVKNSINTMTTNYNTIQEKVKAGDPSGLWNLQFTEDPENPVGGFTEGIFNIQRFVNMIPAGLMWAGKGIKKGFDNTVSKVKNSINTMATNYVAIDEKVKAGDPSGLWNLQFSEDPENPVGGFTEAIFNIQRFVNMPGAAISWVGHKIGNFFTNMIETSKSNHSTMDTAINAIKAFADNGDLKSIWNEDPQFESGDPLKFVWSAGFNISRLFQSAVAIFNKIIGPVMDTVNKAKEIVGGFADSVGDFAEETVDTVKSGAQWVGDKAKSSAKWVGQKAADVGSWLYEGAQSLFGFGGGASGLNGQHISQHDSRYKDMKLGSYTVGEKGCGPAVASMIANSYGVNLPMDKAVQMAQKYQDEGGTKSLYFADTLSSAGINTKYLSGNNIPEQVLSKISRGEQVILMGRNAKNVSKDTSPFGPNNHYVIASGIDKNGNIIIRDPESSNIRTYSPDILKSASMGISTSKSAGSATNYDTDIARKVYGYFTSKGYSPLVTSAIMGNLYGESGMNPAIIQGNGKGPAAGIAQWENYNTKSGRWKGLSDFANSMGYAWSDLDPQLHFIHKELQGLDAYFAGKGKAMNNLTKVGATPTTYAEWLNSTDLDMATKQFEAAFERAGKPHMEGRLKAAREYYNLYSGSTYTGSYTAGEPGVAVDANGYNTVSSDGTSSSSNGFTSILGAISTAFSKIGDLFGFGSNEESSTGGISSYDGSYGTTGSYMGNYPSADLPTLSTNATQNFIDIAKSQVGVTEQPDNITEYGEFTGLNGQPWCASFVSWAMNKAYGGDSEKANKAMLGGPTGSCSTLYNRFKNGNMFTVDKPMPGDIILYKNDGSNFSTKPAKHTGIVVDVNGDTVNTVEGNTSSDGSVEANGGIVWTKERKIGSSALLGFARPDWGANMSGSIAKPGAMNNNKIGNITMSAAGSGLGKSMSSLMKAKFDSGKVQSNVKPKSVVRKSAGASAITPSKVTTTTNMLTNLKNNISTSSTRSGGISAEVVEKLLTSIIKILETISNNTSSVDKIYQVLSAYVQSGGSNAKAVVAAKTAEASSNNNTELDSTIVDLVGTLAQLAKG